MVVVVIGSPAVVVVSAPTTIVACISPATIVRVTAPTVVSAPAPTVKSPRSVPAPSPAVVRIAPAKIPIRVVPAVKATPSPIVVVYIDGKAGRVVSPSGVAIIGVVVGEIVGLLTQWNGVVLHLTGIAINIGEDFFVQYFGIFISLLAKIIAIYVLFLFLNAHGLCRFFLYTDYAVTA
jgi:hypothetical protein